METKYRRGIFLSFGITFALIVAMIVVWKLKFYDAVTKKITTTNGSYTTAADRGTKLKAELDAAAIAQENLVLAQEQLNYFRQRFRSLRFDLTPTPGDGPRLQTWAGYMNEYFSNYGLAMRDQLKSAANDSGVVLTTSLKVESPPQVPELVAAPASGFLKPVAGSTISVDVIGDMPAILRFLERINRSPILMTVGTIKLEGASPLIKATFPVTPYLVATGPSVVLPAGGAITGTTTSTGTTSSTISTSGSSTSSSSTGPGLG